LKSRFFSDLVWFIKPVVSSVLSLAESTVFCGFLRIEVVNVQGISVFKACNSGRDMSPESRFERVGFPAWDDI
jgi:hypothetical protein